MHNSTKTLIEKYWNAVNNRDWSTFLNLVAEDIVYDLPQTRERIHGSVDFKEFNETYPGDWTLSIKSLVSDQNQAASIISFLDNGEQQTGITFFEIRNDRIQKITEYWPTPYQPPPRNYDGIERY